MKNVNKLMSNHLGNISRQLGNDVSTKYSYIISQNDLVNAWTQAHADLGYPLKKESYRDRYLVFNKQGLEEQINKLVIETIFQQIDELSSLLAEDTYYKLDRMLSGLSINQSVDIFKGNNKASKLTIMIARGLAKGLVKIAEETFKYD